MKNNYDNIAPYYDRLSRLVFGKAQVNAQLSLLEQVLPNSSILIAGGGTGWILEALAVKYSGGLHITYVESSGVMLALSRKRNYGQNEVSFVHLAIEDFVAPHTYDTIITPFLFDNFSVENAAKIFVLLDHVLRPGGQWLFTDFAYNRKNNRLWQRLLLRVMYLFFRVISQVEAASLPDMEVLFSLHGYTPVARSVWYRGFILAVAYHKPALS